MRINNFLFIKHCLKFVSAMGFGYFIWFLLGTVGMLSQLLPLFKIYKPITNVLLINCWVQCKNKNKFFNQKMSRICFHQGKYKEMIWVLCIRVKIYKRREKIAIYCKVKIAMWFLSCFWDLRYDRWQKRNGNIGY